MSPSLGKPWIAFETYRGIAITQRGRTYRAFDLRFKSVRLAREHIDQALAKEREIADARASLSLFTPERPMMVGPTIYRLMQLEPALADMMDRVRQYHTDGIVMPKPDIVVRGTGQRR